MAKDLIRMGRKTYYMDAQRNELTNVNNPRDKERMKFGGREFYLRNFGVSEITKTD